MENKNVKIRPMSEILYNSPVQTTQRQMTNVEQIIEIGKSVNIKNILSEQLSETREMFRVNFGNIDYNEMFYKPYAEFKRDMGNFADNYLNGLNVDDNIKRAIKEAVKNTRIDTAFENKHEEIIYMTRPKVYSFGTYVTENATADNKTLSDYVNVKGTVKDVSTTGFNISSGTGVTTFPKMFEQMIVHHDINSFYIAIMSAIIFMIFTFAVGKNIKTDDDE